MAKIVKFDKELADLRARLVKHVLSADFTGSLISLDNKPLPGTIEIAGIEVDEEFFAHLFMLPNGSRCASEIEENVTPDFAPPGIYVRSQHAWIEDYNRVGLYRASSSDGDDLKGVFVDHVFFLESKSPPQLATFCFAHLALAAYELGFDEVTLLAAGGAPSHASLWGRDDMVGYKVWPKFGLDAPLKDGETGHVPHLSHCRTVSGVRKKDLDWWENQGGNGRVMRFDLHPNSESWQVLLAYIRGKKEFT